MPKQMYRIIDAKTNTLIDTLAFSADLHAYLVAAGLYEVSRTVTHSFPVVATNQIQTNMPYVPGMDD